MSNVAYSYHPDTKEFVTVCLADESPLEPGLFLVPANATPVKPPVTAANEIAVFGDGVWSTTPDFRGQSYWLNGAEFKIDSLGESPPTGSTPDKPAATLAELKVVKNADINAARLAANRGTFTHGGKEFACDELSRSDIDGANGMIANLGAMPPGWPGGWKAVDNSYHPIADVAAWKAFYASMFAAGNGNFAHAQALKDALAAATTPEQVSAIAW